MAYYYCIGVPTTMTGYVSVTPGSANVGGSGTAFLSEFVPGDYIAIVNEIRIVNTVTSDVLMATTVVWTITATSVTADRTRLVNVETLVAGFPAPKGSFQPYSQPQTLGNGLVRGGGWKLATWRWGFLTRAQRDALRAYCTGASANVYIKTSGVDNADAYVVYAAVMIWPLNEDRQTGRRLDFEVKFQSLVAV